MDLYRAKAALCRLLFCNIDQLEFEDLRVLVRRRELLWHPDGNRDLQNPFSEQLTELVEAWKIFSASKTGKQGNSSAGQDLFRCDDSPPPPPKRPASDPEPDSDDPGWGKWDRRQRFRREAGYFAERKKAREVREPDYNVTPFDEEFFTPSPGKKFAVPDGMRHYFRSASNRRAGKFFSLFSLARNLENGPKLYRRFANQLSYFGVYSMSTDQDLMCILVLLDSDYRLADIKKECEKAGISPVQAFYSTKVERCIGFCKAEYGQPKQEPVKYAGTSSSTPERTKKMNFKMLSDFALAYETTDPYELMFDYAHLSTGCDRSPAEITNEHESDHAEHLENARIFEHFSDKKRIAKNAVESVVAKLLVQSRRESNLQFINRRCKEIGHEIQDNFSTDDVGEAWFYCSEVIRDFSSVSQHILKAFIDGTPRERYVVLRGTFRSGKTSFASAWCKLLEGTNVNVNVDKGRLPFYLGQAIGKRFVLFDDVKGQPLESEDLTYGTGFENLDDLRDHIDGHVEVQLEQKHLQPVSQIFPCGIITCNAYHIPKSLKERIVGPIDLHASPLFRFHAARKITKETIFIGLVLFNLLPVQSHVFEFLYQSKSKWESEHNRSDCSCLKVPRPKEPERKES